MPKCSMCNDLEWIPVYIDGRMVMKECQCRARRKVERALAKMGMTMDDYQQHNLSTFPGDTDEARKMKALAEKYIAERTKGQGIAFVGKSGTLKTSICRAICNELVFKKGEMYTYWPYRNEVQKLKGLMYRMPEKYADEIYKLVTCDNLFIDDLLKFASKSNGEMQLQDLQILYEIINGRYLNKKAILVTSEYTISEIIEIDEALGSRIMQMCSGFGMYCTGANRRLAVV